MSTDKSVYAAIFRLNLEHIMTQRGLTQKAFAAFLGISQTTVSNWMTGKSTAGLDSLVRISAKTGYSTDKLMGNVPPGLQQLEQLGREAGVFSTAVANLFPDEAIVAAAEQEVAAQSDVDADSKQGAASKTRRKAKKGKRKTTTKKKT